MKKDNYYNAIKAGHEVVIVGQHNENTTVFWMDGGSIYSWNRELGMMERDDMPEDRFTNHCKRMRSEYCQIFIRG